MTGVSLEIALHVVAGLAAGGLIGLERSFHGRPAGFRTHTLVCMASAALMAVSVLEPQWFPGGPGAVRFDPTRVAAGIMTGIGFLGAGVIFKEGFTVRGLTTAASIWITAGIGVLMGVGLYFAGGFTTLLTLGVLGWFRRIERRLPSQQYAFHRVRFERDNVVSEQELRRLLEAHGFAVTGMSYQLVADGRMFEYQMTILTTDADNYARLASALGSMAPVREFVILPSGG